MISGSSETNVDDTTKIGFYGVWMMMKMIQSMENKKNKEMFIIKGFLILRVATKPPIIDDTKIGFYGEK